MFESVDLIAAQFKRLVDLLEAIAVNQGLVRLPVEPKEQTHEPK